MGHNWFCTRCEDAGIVGFWLWKRVCPVCKGYPERYWRLQHSPYSPLKPKHFAEMDQIWAEKETVRDIVNDLVRHRVLIGLERKKDGSVERYVV